MLTFTLDTNCIIDLAEDGRPQSDSVRCLVSSHEQGNADVALVGVSAAERQRGDRYIENADEFLARVASLNLATLPVLKGMGYFGLSFFDLTIYADEAMKAREKEIHAVLFPDIPFRWLDYTDAQGIDREGVKTREAHRWRNAFCDRQMFWAHDYAGREVFVTSDRNFWKLPKAASFPLARIMTPTEAVQALAAA